MLLRLLLTFALGGAVCCAAAETEPIDIGSRLELMVDDYLIERMSGGAKLRLHRPTERELVMVNDKPWEGNRCGYYTIFQDGDLYRMYYRGSQLILKSNGASIPYNYICYAESTDGIHWRRPELGLIEFEGSKKNNIILSGEVAVQALTPFRDPNPNCKAQEQYKALSALGLGLYAFASPDGIHWTLMSDKPVITKGKFDSQNLAFWDSVRGEYREYHRAIRHGRDIMTGTSKDFLNWTEPVWLQYHPSRITELYTNQVTPYHRAPHIFLGFPARYWAGRGFLTPLNERIARSQRRFGTDYTDGGFMTSRDGNSFQLWPEAFIRPGLVQKGRWVYGANYQNWGIIETKPETPGTPNELSIYAREGLWENPAALRRYTLRIDGFVSVSAPLSGGEFVTKPLVFQGKELVMNFSTSAAGSVRVEIQRADGKPMEGFALADCPEIFGDQIEQVIAWKGGSDVSKLTGKPIRLRFVIKDADLYSMCFRK